MLFRERDFTSETIKNAEEFVAFASQRYLPPSSIDPGYQATFSVSWDVRLPIEVEIFEDCYEFYRFVDGLTEIEKIAHHPGEPFPERLGTLLTSDLSKSA